MASDSIDWETVAVMTCVGAIFSTGVFMFIGFCNKNKMFYDNIPDNNV